jgi:hypothetical protein
VNQGQKFKLGALGNGKYIFVDAPNEVILEEIQSETSLQLLVKEDGKIFGTLVPFQPWEIKSNTDPDFFGRYYSPELEVYYDIKQDGDHIVFYHPRRGAEILQPRELDVFDHRGLRIVLVRDPDQKPAGLRVSNGRVRNLWMEKVTCKESK